MSLILENRLLKLYQGHLEREYEANWGDILSAVDSARHENTDAPTTEKVKGKRKKRKAKKRSKKVATCE